MSVLTINQRRVLKVRSPHTKTITVTWYRTTSCFQAPLRYWISWRYEIVRRFVSGLFRLVKLLECQLPEFQQHGYKFVYISGRVYWMPVKKWNGVSRSNVPWCPGSCNSPTGWNKTVIKKRREKERGMLGWKAVRKEESARCISYTYEVVGLRRERNL